MLHPIAWYVEQFGVMKIDFQTRRNRADNELLVFLLEDGPVRVTYMCITLSGIAIACEGGFSVFADWTKGDRFEHMYQAMCWITLPIPISPPQMRWTDQMASEEVPPLPIQRMLG